MLIIASTGFCVMSLFLMDAVVTGHLLNEGRVLIAMPWGRMSLVDLYTGLLLFCCWIGWREQNKYVAIIWMLMLLVFGNLASCLYVLMALYQARGRTEVFFYGQHCVKM